jgi:RimJ/RimL family protein N-acetyltransferase
MELALNFAFRELNLYRVQLTVFSYNERALKLYEKMGFKREGVFRDFIQRDGRRHDMILFGLLRREWAERLSNLEINPS